MVLRKNWVWMRTKHPSLRTSKIKDQGVKHLREYPEVIQALTLICKELHERGCRRFGIDGVFQVLRYNVVLKMGIFSEIDGVETPIDCDFKLTNALKSFYARLIMKRNPELDGLFRLKQVDYSMDDVD